MKNICAQHLEEEFYRSVNAVISNKITPIYITFNLIFAAVFAYFATQEDNTCFAREKSAWGVEYANTENVTDQFYKISCAGAALLTISSAMFHLQSKSHMFDMMRPFVIVTNLTTLVWFISLQYYRFKDTGRACSGDYLDKMPENYGTIYLGDQGQWFLIYTILQYLVYIANKVVSIVITNKLEAEFETKKA